VAPAYKNHNKKMKMKIRFLKIISIALPLLIFSLMQVASSRDQSLHENNRKYVRDIFSDTWVAEDNLGRVLPTFEQVGPPRKDKFIGILYFLWLGEHGNTGPYNISTILMQDPSAMQNPNSKLWGALGAFHHWGKPLFDYYLSDDTYVLRKHAQMLADAGVDVIFFDVTNNYTYKKNYMTLLKVFSEIRNMGGKTPQIAFLCPFSDPTAVANELYANLYKPGLYKDLWFKWDGKPLILADPKLIPNEGDNLRQNIATLLKPSHTLGQTFNVSKPFNAVGGRFPTWGSKNSSMTLTLYRNNQRNARVEIVRKKFEDILDNSWLTVQTKKPLPPGKYYLEMSEAKNSVGWWSHEDDIYPEGHAEDDGLEKSGDRTLHFSFLDSNTLNPKNFFSFRKVQPDYFQGPREKNTWSWLETYPQRIYRNVKGEKEQMSVSVAQNAVKNRLSALSELNAQGRSWHNGYLDNTTKAVQYGYNFAEQFEKAIKEDPKIIFITGWNEWVASRYNEFNGIRKPVIFVDEFNQEFSRDIEPMEGGHSDNYYYQMISYIRRFKGVRRSFISSSNSKIIIDGNFSDWTMVKPEYLDDAYDTAKRNHPGWNRLTRYINSTGRNDFIMAKVLNDKKYIYFYVKAREKITSSQEKDWMFLFLRINNGTTNNWKGYNFLLNRTVKNSYTSTVEENKGDWNWSEKGEALYRVKGKEMELAVLRSDLHLEETMQPFSFDFKWADGTKIDGNIENFAINGDVAPNSRFNYRYTYKK
jgi:hypothetical protein